MIEPIRIVIVEDEFVVAKDIEMHLKKSGYEICGIFKSGDQAIDFFTKNSADILLIDIKIQGALDGIQTAEIITATADIPFIYITASSDAETFNKAIKTKPSSYIIKPFNFSNLNSSIELALYNFSNNKTAMITGNSQASLPEQNGYAVPKNIFVKKGNKFERLSSANILFVVADGSYCSIETKQRKYKIAQNLQHFIDRIDDDNFVRIHRSYVVNIEHIDTIKENIVLVNNNKLLISRHYRPLLMARIKSV